MAPEPFGCGFDVYVLPDFILGSEHTTYAAARDQADRLSEEYGWRIVDSCPERIA